MHNEKMQNDLSASEIVGYGKITFVSFVQRYSDASLRAPFRSQFTTLIAAGSSFLGATTEGCPAL